MKHRKKQKKIFIPNRITHYSLYLSTALWIFTKDFPSHMSFMHRVSLTEVNYSI